MSSAKDQMTKMLDQLMGQNRDGNDTGREKTFVDKEVCRPFILGICINELFVNTRAELPDCPKLHSLALKSKFEESSKTRDYHFEEEVLDFLSNFIRDNDRKIDHAKTRLHHTQDAPENEEKLDKIHELAVQIGEKVAKAEDLGAQGLVDESLAIMASVDEVKVQKKSLEDEYHCSIPRHAVQQQKLRACEVCGAFLSMYDNDRRLADHFGGKLHIGFVTIRDKMKQLEEVIKTKNEKKMKEREEYQKEREEYQKDKLKRQRSRSRDRDCDRSYDRDRDRSRERDHDRGRDGDHERGRDGDHERGRDGEHDQGRDGEHDRGRDRSPDRRRSRSRERERRRDRDDRRRSARTDSRERDYRDYRDRDRDRERSRRSRSRERNGRHRDRDRSRSR